MKLTVPDVVPALITYFRGDGNGAGGRFHSLLSNDPTDSAMRYVWQDSVSQGDDLAEAITLALLTMSRTQRSKAIRIAYRDAHVPRGEQR